MYSPYFSNAIFVPRPLNCVIDQAACERQHTKRQELAERYLIQHWSVNLLLAQIYSINLAFVGQKFISLR